LKRDPGRERGAALRAGQRIETRRIVRVLGEQQAVGAPVVVGAGERTAEAAPQALLVGRGEIVRGPGVAGSVEGLGCAARCGIGVR
jgi:hypothetical protein